MKIHIPLPPRCSLAVPFVGTFLLAKAMAFIQAHRPDLFKDDSPYSVVELIPETLWLARKR